MDVARRSLVPLVLAGALAAGLSGPARADESSGAGELAVIVNRANTCPDPSLDDLRAILTLSQQFWKDGKRVVLLVPSSGSPTKSFLLEKIYQRTDDQLRRDWARRLFAGEIPAVPTSLRTVEALVAAVSHSPGAVTVVPATAVLPENVRVLAVDGKRPGEPGYRLSTGGY
jgi:hypothetical protein